MAKPHVTRTLGPIHFEDLDPHRFEDLVRQLVYDLKQWQSIESTGKGGADDGFDIRAYEVASANPPVENEEEKEEAPHPMEGNLWMIQCKREKELGPKRVEDIIKDAVSPEAPPYGYILAAPANFSKAAHDAFRDELRKRGVMEFYLWGAGELEDMLYQPKNDHVLFAFFGISLASRRRSKTTEVRATVGIKNKLMRVLGDDARHSEVLIRDLDDVHYPYEGEYKDFDERPRWKGFRTVGFHPRGLIVAVAEHFAYMDKKKGLFDFTKEANLLAPVRGEYWIPRDEENEKKRLAAKGFWEQLPRKNRVTFVRNGLIRFDSIAFVDDKGDAAYKCPHLYIPFMDKGPFDGFLHHLEVNQHHNEELDEFERATIFPKTFPQPTFGVVHADKTVSVDDRTRSMLGHHSDGGFSLYDAEGKYAFLKPFDVIGVEKSEDKQGRRVLLKITNTSVARGEELLAQCAEDPSRLEQIERQLGRKLAAKDSVRVIEVLAIQDWQIEQNRPVV